MYIPFNKSFASHEKSKYWSKKNIIKPNDIMMGSQKKFIFDCNICNHEFITTPEKIKNNGWCGYCSNNKLCDNNDCQICFLKSFASHDKAKYWSKKNTISARQIFKKTIKNYIFNCNSCNHEFISIPLNIVNNNSWCPYCSIPTKKICASINCELCFNKSFASSDKIKYWSKDNIENPRLCLKFSDSKKYIFECDICNHKFFKDLYSIHRGEWCPYCANVFLCKENNCVICFNKSFASYDKSKYWCETNKLKPREVFKYARNKYWFICDKNHRFKSPLYTVSINTWCPLCINKTEKIFYDILIKKYKTLNRQYKVNWCKNKTYLPYDFVLPDNKIIIELDGDQHFRQISNWQNAEKTQYNDIYKMLCANKYKYSIIRILQMDVYCNKYDWLDELIKNIDIITNSDNTINIYMCKNNEYENHKKLYDLLHSKINNDKSYNLTLDNIIKIFKN